MECWIDAMNFLGHTGSNFLRGPSFSNMVKTGRCEKGQFKLSDFTLEERGERFLLGAAVPSVRAINKRMKPEDKIEHGGMSRPLEACVEELGRAIPARLSVVMGVPLQPLTQEQVATGLQCVEAAVFDDAAARRALHGERPRARLVLPKKPAGGWKEADKEQWWAQPLPSGLC